MTPLAMIRHGQTEWNEAGRVQSRSDIPLSCAGRKAVQQWRVPEGFGDFVWFASPLRRAVETAELLSDREVTIDDRLIEMDWSAWEGKYLWELRAEIGDLRDAWQAKGLDFRAPGGESPRQVQERLRSFFLDRVRAGTPTIAVCHRGIIRATYALATGWDMMSSPADKLTDDSLHLFRLRATGRPEIDRLNIPLTV
jgi:probable phosphoglycerate mutase